MTGYEKMWCVFWFCACTILCTIVVSITVASYHHRRHVEVMAAEGYEQVAESLPGVDASVTTWKKVAE